MVKVGVHAFAAIGVALLAVESTAAFAQVDGRARAAEEARRRAEEQRRASEARRAADRVADKKAYTSAEVSRAQLGALSAPATPSAPKPADSAPAKVRSPY